MPTRKIYESPDITDDYLSVLYTIELMDILSSKTLDLLAVLHERDNRHYALGLKKEVERIQAAIRKRRSE